MSRFDINREGIKVACVLNGGIREISRRSGIDYGNMNRWFRGKPTLSDEKIALLLNAIKMPLGKPDRTIVHDWSIKLSPIANISPALKLYFPNGAEIAEAPWSAPTLKNVIPSYIPGMSPKNLFALTDGDIRAVLRSTQDVTLHWEHYRKFGSWKHGDRKKAIIKITEYSEWTSRTPTVREFDDVWNGTQSPATLNDLDEAVKREKISYEVAIERVRKKNK